MLPEGESAVRSMMDSVRLKPSFRRNGALAPTSGSACGRPLAPSMEESVFVLRSIRLATPHADDVRWRGRGKSNVAESLDFLAGKDAGEGSVDSRDPKVVSMSLDGDCLGDRPAAPADCLGADQR